MEKQRTCQNQDKKTSRKQGASPASIIRGRRGEHTPKGIADREGPVTCYHTEEATAALHTPGALPWLPIKSTPNFRTRLLQSYHAKSYSKRRRGKEVKDCGREAEGFYNHFAASTQGLFCSSQSSRILGSSTVCLQLGGMEKGRSIELERLGLMCICLHITMFASH